ncbi:MAG: serine hydrolase domain-containing protein [Pseudomonadota bacterium]
MINSAFNLGCRILVATVLAGLCLNNAQAAEFRVPTAHYIESNLERYVESAEMAPGVVVGIWSAGQRSIHAYGDAGRADVALDGDALFEIGSISKVFTALLLSQMVSAGEVRFDQTVAELAPDGVPLADPIGAITLEQLATHTSGLPRLAFNFGPAMRGLFSNDPYAGSTPAEIVASVSQLRPEQLTEAGRFVYSNLGYALLGQLLAEQAGMQFNVLLKQRVLTPLSVSSIAFGPAEADAGRLAQGVHRGRATAHWNLDAYTPAGGLVASVHQMLDFIEAHLSGQADFVTQALQPRGLSSDESPRTLGLGYAHRTVGDVDVIWHNGGTGGFRSWFGVAPSRDFGLVVLSNGTGNVDALVDVLIDAEADTLPSHRASWLGLVMASMGVVVAPLTLLTGVFAKTKASKSGRRRPDRIDLLVLIASAGMLLVISRRAGDWISVPFSFWWLGFVVSIAAALAMLRARWGEREWRSGSALVLLARLSIVALALLIVVLFV